MFSEVFCKVEVFNINHMRIKGTDLDNYLNDLNSFGDVKFRYLYKF